ncbi:aminoacyl-tRNA hydrolase [Lishizhenia sp.]|uniref:aminoacyl-tRNA hydrolase n=1 Tax=Lishizhenia sp. TaxID=2497594 RepID=UPI00299DE10F|nr:aminoacyl-tRNA hydrolase [Lishizhenia sp.]MDX1445435.1 aminoacyl-tRNA hydrolase [Lishizhenia sp.]
MKYLIVGLGNPGAKYENTRHNIGFKVVEKFAEERGAEFETLKHAQVAHAKWKGRQVVLIKPTTFMNLSGKAVNYWMQQEKIPLSNVLVIMDDISLPFGTLRLKGKGSDAGHNGLKDIQKMVGTPKYARLKFGVGNDFHPGQQADYVLGEWKKKEALDLPERIEMSTNFIKDFTTIGLQMTMTNWNNK